MAAWEGRRESKRHIYKRKYLGAVVALRLRTNHPTQFLNGATLLLVKKQYAHWSSHIGVSTHCVDYTRIV